MIERRFRWASSSEGSLRAAGGHICSHRMAQTAWKSRPVGSWCSDWRSRAGPAPGLVTTTSAEGVFSLYGVSGETTLSVTKDGYARLTQTFSVTDHLTSITIEFLFLGGHPDVSGTYTLTIAAASDCGIGVGQGNLPEEVRVRSYAAAVEQDDGFLRVTLSGPGFLTALWSNVFTALFRPIAPCSRCEILMTARRLPNGSPDREFSYRG